MTDAKTPDEKQLIDEKRMDDMAVAPGEPGHEDAKKDGDQVAKKDLKDADRDEENLEEGIEESMDASDPPSSTQP